ncbi:tetraacyldisaccharide 4'-kinase [Marinomonas piezotolerans]|uniref:Tetraacyldisaccharide 4'-kinase n=1 Tax=Marinomonas piezotolerans TaxID=2213058 RepID=A0A370UDN5_9GAMM|nr:tetraacyldisaccharide 4'-kinase [Marinomonas piezotolerans]RDL45893.1 tetraacyldisaccharide 4'-kinase [Marinomonas piezotolerans]
MSIETLVTQSWYRKLGWTWLLAPLLLLTAPFVYLKRHRYLRKKHTVYRSTLPVIVVGNITIGGTGKSPMVIALAKKLVEMGFKPGIVSRGHKRQATGTTIVTTDSNSSEVGDEPLMLYRRTGCPVAVCEQRVEAIRALESSNAVDIIISDDGLQHYRMERDIEIVMIDAQRKLGNKMLLPVGPLREWPSRLKSVDFCFSIGEIKEASLPCSVTRGLLELASIKSVNGLTALPLDSLKQDEWVVVAGIGNPSRFKKSLIAHGLPNATKHLFFPDHHAYTRNDMPSNRRVIMTEKDAVKVEQFALESDNWWYSEVGLMLPKEFQAKFEAKLKRILSEKH